MKKIMQTGKEKKQTGKETCSLLPPTQSGKHMGYDCRKVPVFLSLKHPAIPTLRFSSLWRVLQINAWSVG